MSNNNPMTCTGCYHSTKEETPSICRECEICIRNPSVFSNRTLEKTVDIDGVAFTAPMDLYITHDRKRFEDWLFMKKLQEIAISRKDFTPMPNPMPYPNPASYPNYPSPYWRTKWYTKQVYTEDMQKCDDGN